MSQVYRDEQGRWWVIDQNYDTSDHGPFETEEAAWEFYDELCKREGP